MSGVGGGHLVVELLGEGGGVVAGEAGGGANLRAAESRVSYAAFRRDRWEPLHSRHR